MISILIGTGFEETEVVSVYDILKRGKLDVELISVTGGLEVSSSGGLLISCDALIDDKDISKEKMIVIPGGINGVKRIMASPSTKEYLIRGFNSNLYIGAICAGPLVLDKFKLLDGYKFTGYSDIIGSLENTRVDGFYNEDKKVVIDRNLITAKGPGFAVDFAFKLLELLVSEDVVKAVHNSWWDKK